MDNFFLCSIRFDHSDPLGFLSGTVLANVTTSHSALSGMQRLLYKLIGLMKET